MSKHIRRIRARIVHILPYLAIGAAVALLVAGAITANSPLADTLDATAVMVGVSGLMGLMGRYQIRVLSRNHDEIMEVLNDKILLTAAAGAADAIHAHLGPDSPWRHNLIKEIADLLNDDNEITVAAVEGSLRDLFKRLEALERNIRHQGK